MDNDQVSAYKKQRTATDPPSPTESPKHPLNVLPNTSPYFSASSSSTSTTSASSLQTSTTSTLPPSVSRWNPPSASGWKSSSASPQSSVSQSSSNTSSSDNSKFAAIAEEHHAKLAYLINSRAINPSEDVFIDYVEDEETKSVKETDKACFPLRISIKEPAKRDSSLKDEEITTSLIHLLINEKFPSFIEDQSSINPKGDKALLIFSDEDERNKARTDIDFFAPFATIDEGSSASLAYYRTVLAVTTLKKYKDDMKKVITQDLLAQRLKETLGVTLSSATINTEKGYITIYFDSFNDWIKTFSGFTFSLKSVYSLKFLHHFASTNAVGIYKVYLSPIPDNWTSINVSTFLQSPPISLLPSNILANTVARDQKSNLSKRISFSFLKDPDTLLKALKFSKFINVEGKRVKIELAKQKKKKVTST